jgi:hypothetical protein
MTGPGCLLSVTVFRQTAYDVTVLLQHWTTLMQSTQFFSLATPGSVDSLAESDSETIAL